MWEDHSITRTHKQPANRDHSAWQRRLTAERDKFAPCPPPPFSHRCHFCFVTFCSSLLQPLCFDSALYLYFKWLNYAGSCRENYGCFPLFLSAGTPWPLRGSNNSPSSLFSPFLFIHLSLFSSSLTISTPPSPINILLPFCDWEEIIAKWSCLCALGTESWQKVFSW